MTSRHYALIEGIRIFWPPQRRDMHMELIATLEWMRDQRAEKYPAMIAAGTVEQERADREIALLAECIADCRFLFFRQGAPSALATFAARRALLCGSLNTLKSYAREDDRFDEERARQVECLAAILAWHFDPDRYLTRIAEIRRESAEQQREMPDAA